MKNKMAKTINLSTIESKKNKVSKQKNRDRIMDTQNILMVARMGKGYGGTGKEGVD